MIKVESMKFDVSYNQTFSFNPECYYYEYCERRNITPSQKGFEKYCIECIYDMMMDKDNLKDFIINGRENHIDSITKLTA